MAAHQNESGLLNDREQDTLAEKVYEIRATISGAWALSYRVNGVRTAMPERTKSIQVFGDKAAARREAEFLANTYGGQMKEADDDGLAIM